MNLLRAREKDGKEEITDSDMKTIAPRNNFMEAENPSEKQNKTTSIDNLNNSNFLRFPRSSGISCLLKPRSKRSAIIKITLDVHC